MSTSPPVWMLVSSLAAGMGLVCAPAAWIAPTRSIVRDALFPGQLVVGSLVEWTGEHCQRAWARINLSSSGRTSDAEKSAADDRVRQLEAETALLREQIQLLRDGTGGGIAQPTEPLFVPDLVEARILGEETRARISLKGKQLLGVGERDGMEAASLVLAGNAPHLDLGRDGRVQGDHLVLAGRVVAGKIGKVGQFTSTLVPVTDVHYRGLARLARPAGPGLEFGAEGILEGDGGDTCRLNFVQSTEPVSPGDRVYATAPDGSLPAPLLYGTVVHAELAPGAPHWTIRVKPDVDAARLRTVQVLRTRVNPLRISAQ